MKHILTASCLAISSSAWAYFRDDFDGTKIDMTKWSEYVECVSWIDYEMTNGMLHVTGMHYPFCRETVYLIANGIQETTDRFKVSVRVGWEDLEGYFVFGVRQFGVSEVNPARMSAIPGGVGGSVGGNSGSLPAPRAGFVTLSIEREKRPNNNNYYWLYMDDQLVTEGLATVQRVDMFSLYIGFGAGSENDPMSYYVDWAEFVPEPASFSVLGLGLAALALRRRRRS